MFTIRRIMTATALTALIVAMPGGMDPLAFKIGFKYAHMYFRETILRDVYDWQNLPLPEVVRVNESFAGFMGFLLGCFLQFGGVVLCLTGLGCAAAKSCRWLMRHIQ